MESDDDYQQFSNLDEPSSPIPQNKLKRLKKAIRVSSNEPISQPIDPIPSSNIIDSNISSDQEVLESLDVDKPVDLVHTVSESEEVDGGKDLDNELDDLFVYRDLSEDQTMLEVEREEIFEVSNVIEEEFDGSDKLGDLEMGEKKKKKSVKEKGSLKEGEEENKKKRSKKRGKSVDEKENSEVPARNKRKLEKERQAYLKELHAESQRLLRETRDAEFKPAPLVHKPISSILEKIRQRKLEVSKKVNMLNNHVETNGCTREIEIDLYPEEASNANLGDNEHTKEGDISLVNRESNDADDTHMENSREPTSLPSPSKTTLSNTASEESKSLFRAPINDTEDLFDDFQQSDGEDLKDSEENNPVEEVLAPSVLAMNLMLDSAPPEDVNESGTSSSDEENYDKENIDPHPYKPIDRDLYSKGDPVKAFVDDEAEEEDDSDNDLMQFKENDEDEENEDNEELNDLIVTGYNENPSDNVKRDQLHQMWLQQQDAAATDNVLQRLKCGGKQHGEPTALNEVEEDDGDFSDASVDDDADDSLPTNVARVNSKKIREMIPQMFTDKDDDFLSSDDEETERTLVKMRLLEKAEERAPFLSPAEDENSREVFGLIKKLNIAPEPKKNAKSSSFFDKLITGGNSNSSSKSSFLGRASSSSLPSSNKAGSSNFRSYIFGRDDSNSRSSITASEVSSDVGENSKRPNKTASAKFSSSQSKLSSQKITQTSSRSSLLEILRRSTQSDTCMRNNTIGETQVAVQFAAFKSGKKSLKIDARK
ncbi:hypothetical protein AQUCO_01000445v1 [Aquilegia coerulea]|uniref:DNA replication checkpoint mediator MRC1 domain-containing protein n=1 Tax=Aquilegia coerulea TaxID=218851 RepID=A0A2G5EA45_AQUCA|nr:hypothetical protein AQUCO_01000445v1 [Aquilegia coerulea]